MAKYQNKEVKIVRPAKQGDAKGSGSRRIGFA
jgi:hypothetical protein